MTIQRVPDSRLKIRDGHQFHIEADGRIMANGFQVGRIERDAPLTELLALGERLECSIPTVRDDVAQISVNAGKEALYREKKGEQSATR